MKLYSITVILAVMSGGCDSGGGGGATGKDATGGSEVSADAGADTTAAGPDGSGTDTMVAPGSDAVADTQLAPDSGEDTTAKDSAVETAVAPDVAQRGGCPALDFAPASLPDGNFASPAGMVIADKYAIVANGNLDENWAPGQGFITVVDIYKQQVVNRLATTHPNPQFVTAKAGRVFVTDANAIAWGEFSEPAGPGALDVFDLATIETAQKPDATLVLPLDEGDPLAGSPGSVVVSDDGETAWVGSGTAGHVYELDLADCSVVHGGGDPIVITETGGNDTLTLEEMGDLILVGSMNTDEVHVLDTINGALDQPPFPAPFHVGPPGGFGGVVDLAVTGPDASSFLALMTLDPQLAPVSLFDGKVGPETVKAGLYPNRVAVLDQSVFIVNSGDDAIQRVDLVLWESTADFAQLPPGTNPWDITVVGTMAIPRGYVTGLMSNSLFVINLADGSVEAEIK